MYREDIADRTKYNLWNTEQSVLQNVFVDNPGTVKFSPNNQHIGFNNLSEFKIFNIDENGNVELIAEYPEQILIRDFRFSANGEFVYIIERLDQESVIIKWGWGNDLPPETSIFEQTGITADTFSVENNGVKLYPVTQDGEHQFYDAMTNELMGNMPLDVEEIILGVIPDSDVVVTYPLTSPVARMWNLTESKPVDDADFTSVILFEWTLGDTELRISPVGNYIMVFNEAGFIRFWGVIE